VADEVADLGDGADVVDLPDTGEVECDAHLGVTHAGDMPRTGRTKRGRHILFAPLSGAYFGNEIDLELLPHSRGTQASLGGPHLPPAPLNRVLRERNAEQRVAVFAEVPGDSGGVELELASHPRTEERGLGPSQSTAVS
jgi:hypothetical protein